MISIWEKETFFAPYDIAIVGSGFVGLWSAFQLKKKKPKLNICIVERGVIPTGASTRNAGFACFGSLSELMYDAQTMGVDTMLQLVEMRFKGIQRIKKYFSNSEIDFERVGGYELYDKQDNINTEELLQNIAYLNLLVKHITDTKRTFKLEDGAISTFGFRRTKHLVRNKTEGYLHSGKLLQTLLQTVQSMGVQVFTNTTVKLCKTTSTGYQLQTDHPFTLTSKQVLICTNAFARQLLPDADVVPARGQILVTSPIPGLPFKGTFHSNEGFYYFRNLGNRILLGGARNKALKEEESFNIETTDFIQHELERYLAETILPNHKYSYTIDYRWSGIMAMGSEKMPIIKEIQPGMFCAIRMSGMGVALAPIVSQQVAKLML